MIVQKCSTKWSENNFWKFNANMTLYASNREERIVNKCPSNIIDELWLQISSRRSENIASPRREKKSAFLNHMLEFWHCSFRRCRILKDVFFQKRYTTNFARTMQVENYPTSTQKKRDYPTRKHKNKDPVHLLECCYKSNYLSGLIVLRCPRNLRWPSTALAMLPVYEGTNTSLSTDMI